MAKPREKTTEAIQQMSRKKLVTRGLELVAGLAKKVRHELASKMAAGELVDRALQAQETRQASRFAGHEEPQGDEDEAVSSQRPSAETRPNSTPEARDGQVLRGLGG